MTSSPQCPMLKVLDSPLMYASFPQAVTLMKKSGESLMVNPKVNLSSPISACKTQVIVTEKCCGVFIPREGAIAHKYAVLYEYTNFFCQGNFWHQFSKWLSLPLSGQNKITGQHILLKRITKKTNPNKLFWFGCSKNKTY